MKVCIKLPNDMTGEVTLPVNLPYDITKYLIGECGLKIDDTLLSKYWRHKETTLDPLAVATRNYRQMAGTVWPLGFYGDEAAMGLVNAPTHQIFGLYMNVPLYRPRSTRLSRFLLFSVEVEKIISVEETIYPVLEAIVESFNQLTSVGVCGLRFLVSEIRGDQAFFRMMFKHRSWWTATKMCFRCGAVAASGPRNYCIYDGNDSWVSTQRSTEEFLVEELPQDQTCHLVQLGFCSVGYHPGFWKSTLQILLLCFWRARLLESGPLVDLHFFEISTLKHCTLHILNLGLLGISNGSSLSLALL